MSLYLKKNGKYEYIEAPITSTQQTKTETILLSLSTPKMDSSKSCGTDYDGRFKVEVCSEVLDGFFYTVCVILMEVDIEIPHKMFADF